MAAYRASETFVIIALYKSTFIISYHTIMTHVICRLTAKNRDQIRNPMFGNQVWATFTFFTMAACMIMLKLDSGDEPSLQFLQTVLLDLK